jgi:BirA family biotin operon repressor/biotin-[acetyl-CoA-carboxylase] ligase
MSTLKYPSILIDLGHVGKHGLPLNSETWYQHDMDLCREWGFRLKIVDDRVSLDFDQDQLVPYWIQKETKAIAWDGLRAHGFLRVGSTNSEALEMARRSAPSGTLVYAEEQTEGKGRRGRSWSSPARAGLYFSLIIRPAQLQKFWPLLNHVASVALVETLKDLSDGKTVPRPLEIDLKWPNDLLLSGKKCAGILLETVPTGEETHAAVLGIGINLREKSLPESLESQAVCLDKMAGTIVPRRLLLVQFLNHFQRLYLSFERGNHSVVLERWKSYSSMCDGTHIWITEFGVRRAAVTCGLDELGALLVRTEEGRLETILAGDVSIRRDLESKNLR